ncbi:DegQ family serine endoprotease [Arenicella xantha]|uniref:Probable periplasmic serine endoprotease DegP-like n=1 Tax=Arenicella xantha TaxID=644221 RepID=A0A395JK73_9GAMM|nr:DegQ family serine endoprotease [Arenicella xantha]RBP50815.1 serine protease Do [Arenicella xantha]
MTKQYTNSLVSIMKWGAVVVATATVVISIQASADGPKADASNAVSSAIRAQDIVPAAQITSDSMQKRSWSPSDGFADLVEDVSPAVVHVATAGFIQRRRLGNDPSMRQFRGPRGFEDFFKDFFGDQFPQNPNQIEPDEPDSDSDAEKQTQPLGIGSGFIISADGYVVTNHHVIDRADEIMVTLPDGTEYEAEIKGSDPKTDLALLKLKDASNLPYLSWGDDEASRVGDWVLAIGNPFGLGGSASTGIISARGRDINAGPYDDFIQVDAAINRGNSGGPLFNMRGEVIGINSMIYSPSGGSVGIGFAIPSHMAKGVIDQLRASGEVERGWIGVSIGPITEELAEVFGRDNEEGALISQVLKGAPADKAGLVAGDIVLSFDGTDIKEMRNLPRTVAQSTVGKAYDMVIWRDGKRKTIKITTEAFPEDDAVAGAETKPDVPVKQESDELLGAELSELNDQLRSRYRISEDTKGVLLTAIERGGLAAENGLRLGDVITKFDNRLVSKPEDVINALKQAKKSGDGSVAVLLNRRGIPGFLAFKLK